MKISKEGGYAFFVSGTAEEAKKLYGISSNQLETKEFMDATGIRAFGYIAQDSARNESNRIRVEPEQVEKVTKYMQDLGFNIEN